MLMHKSQYYVHVLLSLHDQPCIEGVYLEFNTLHGTRIYAHSSAKAYSASCHCIYSVCYAVFIIILHHIFNMQYTRNNNR